MHGQLKLFTGSAAASQAAWDRQASERAERMESERRRQQAEKLAAEQARLDEQPRAAGRAAP